MPGDFPGTVGIYEEELTRIMQLEIFLFCLDRGLV